MTELIAVIDIGTINPDIQDNWGINFFHQFVIVSIYTFRKISPTHAPIIATVNAVKMIVFEVIRKT